MFGQLFEEEIEMEMFVFEKISILPLLLLVPFGVFFRIVSFIPGQR